MTLATNSYQRQAVRRGGSGFGRAAYGRGEELPPMIRVTRERPCPICGAPKWCSVSADGKVCHCMREPKGRLKAANDDGHVHLLGSTGGRQSQRPSRPYGSQTWTIGKPERRRPVASEDSTNWPELASHLQCERMKVAGAAADLATRLGVSLQSLDWLRLGWYAKSCAWAFPMAYGDGEVCGIRLRKPSGRKLAIKGSKSGLFIPTNVPGDLRGQALYIAEGPSDTAALLDLGVAAIGRPDCQHGNDELQRLVQERRPAHVVIVADGDRPGQDGALALANSLKHMPFGPATFAIVTPPDDFKDVRDWKQGGLTAEQLRRLAGSETEPNHDSAAAMEVACE